MRRTSNHSQQRLFREEVLSLTLKNAQSTGILLIENLCLHPKFAGRRKALWYSDYIKIMDTKMHGIKALRECSDVTIENCDIISPEFGRSVSNIEMRHRGLSATASEQG